MFGVSNVLVEPCEAFITAFLGGSEFFNARIITRKSLRLYQRHPVRPLGEPSLDLITTLNSLHSRVRDISPLTVNGRVYGIDLVHRGHEVKKLLHAGFGAYMAKRGYEPEDVLQEVYKGIIARNYGKCPWDASKSSFGHYVHMICHCVLSNYARKMRRRDQFEHLGMRDKDGVETDAGDLAVEVAGGELMDESVLHDMSLWVQGDLRHPEVPLAILPLAAQGYGRSEIAGLTGMEEATVIQGLRELRQSLRRRV